MWMASLSRCRSPPDNVVTGHLDQSELEWWTTQSLLMAELVPDVGARFPRLAAADADGAFEFEHEPDQYLEQEARNGFEFGLERVLDGIEAFVNRTCRRSARRPDGGAPPGRTPPREHP